jgi:hypothetical protein
VCIAGYVTRKRSKREGGVAGVGKTLIPRLRQAERERASKRDSERESEMGGGRQRRKRDRRVIYSYNIYTYVFM